jgi:hypothetical protein
MSYVRFYLAAAVVTGVIGAGAAFAQTPAPKPAPTTLAPTGEPSTSAQVQKWTTKEWNAAKSKWAKEKVKWADCQQQSAEQSLAGRKSWAFLYGCMTT